MRSNQKYEIPDIVPTITNSYAPLIMSSARMCKSKLKAYPAVREIINSTHKDAGIFENKEHGLTTPYISQRPTFWRKIWSPSSKSNSKPFKKPAE
jgi:hypothetical protein